MHLVGEEKGRMGKTSFSIRSTSNQFDLPQNIIHRPLCAVPVSEDAIMALTIVPVSDGPLQASCPEELAVSIGKAGEAVKQGKMTRAKLCSKRRV